ncbi:MAG TPA: TolC family protein [Thermodesulfovibrionales bacterium]|nr:TolC family protein [Thermodesulfovibrionales bacterium]
MRTRRQTGKTFLFRLASVLLLTLFSFFSWIRCGGAAEGELRLQDLIDDALKYNHEILVNEARISASRFRIPQVTSLPDPMVTFGYQNESFKKYTYGDKEGSQWMFTASQSFPYPGKLSLKGEMAAKEAEGLRAASGSIRLKTIEKVKGLYYDLLFAYKSIDIIRDRAALFSRLEDAAVARYSSGLGLQQEVLMVQTEKYMLLEKEEMVKQKIESLEAMINSTVGRNINAPVGRPVEEKETEFATSMEELLATHVQHSPMVREKEEMISAAEIAVKIARKEYYPDFTVNAEYFKRAREFEDMWSLTTSINIPLFYKTKQRQAVFEKEALLSEAVHDLEAVKLMLSSTIRDNYTMVKTAERLMNLYKNGLVPKTYQDFEAALAGYTTGKVEALTVINRLRSLLDYETLYWAQFAEREKAIARLQAVAGTMDSGRNDQ